MSYVLPSGNVCPPTSPLGPFTRSSKWEAAFQDGGYGAPLQRYSDSDPDVYVEIVDDEDDEDDNGVLSSDVSGLQTPADTLRSSPSSSGLSDMDWGNVGIPRLLPRHIFRPHRRSMRTPRPPQ